MQAMLAQVLLGLQLAVLLVVLAGRQSAPYLARVGILLPEATWQAMEEKRVGILMGAWFIGNTIRQNLLSTGAFEVSYAGTTVFSKLESGRMPTMSELMAGVAEAMAAAGHVAAGGDAAALQ